MVQAVQPDAVVVELCRSRQAYMYGTDEQAAADSQLQQGQRPGEDAAGAAALMSAGLGGSTDDEDAAASGHRGRSSSSSSNTNSSYASSSSSSSSGARSRGPAVNPLSLSGGGLLPAFQRSMELGGASALVLRLALGRLSARLSGSLGVQGGAEFVAARQEAEALGAQVRGSTQCSREHPCMQQEGACLLLMH